MHWGVAEAKQQLSRVLKAASTEPQVVETRGELVAIILGPADAAAFLAWRKRRSPKTLGARFAEARLIGAEEGVTLSIPERADRQLSEQLGPLGSGRRKGSVKGSGRAR